MIFLQNITTLDFAYFCPENGLRGESLNVNAEIVGFLNEIGFVMDFGPAKKLLKQTLDELVDHKVLVPSGSANLYSDGFDFETINGTGGRESFSYRAPTDSFVVLPGNRIETSLITSFLENACMAVMPANVQAVKLNLLPDPRFSTEANYRYTHGLRKHDGNCQRLFHGHRNPIEVRLQGQRSTHHEDLLAAELEGAHFVHRDTLRSHLDFQKNRRNKMLGNESIEISYTSGHGKFLGRLPASRIIVMEEEPSIENIAKLCWNRLKEMEPGLAGLEVTAYEGLNKGARFSA